MIISIDYIIFNYNDNKINYFVYLFIFTRYLFKN